MSTRKHRNSLKAAKQMGESTADTIWVASLTNSKNSNVNSILIVRILILILIIKYIKKTNIFIIRVKVSFDYWNSNIDISIFENLIH